MIGTRLKEYRKKKGLTMKELAYKIGFSQGGISEIENDKTAPSTETLLKYVQNTDINLAWVFTGKGTMEATSVMYTDQGYTNIDPRRQAIIQLILDMPDDHLDDIHKILTKEKLLWELIEERKHLKKTE